jgi:hypothetical protein
LDGGRPKKIDIPCKSWRCPACSKVKKNIVLDRCRDGFAGERVRFLTLTLSPDADNKRITQYWNRFKASLYKKGYRRFKYFWVKEFTKQGVCHLHVAISAYIPKSLIDRYWNLATEKTSFITYISYKGFLKNPAGYMTKYMTKQLYEGDLYERGERRFGFSRHQSFLAVKKSYMAQPPRIQFGAHINQDSKYWPEIRDKQIDQAGIYAQQYFEAKTLSPQGLINVLQGSRNQARKIITLLTTDVSAIAAYEEPKKGRIETGDFKFDMGKSRNRTIYKKRYKPKHNKSNIISYVREG